MADTPAQTVPAQTVQVTLPDNALQYLYEQARQRNITPADVLVSALGTDQFVREKAIGENSDVIVKDGGHSGKLVFAPTGR